MTEQAAVSSRKKSPIQWMLRWLIAAVIFWFLGQRLAHDWPAVQDAFGRIAWAWIAVSVIPGFLYFILRITSWQTLLHRLGVRIRFWQASKVWMNGEIIRYIPGNVWSILGRLAQAASIGATRTTVFSSMVLEALLLVAACTALSAVFLIGFPAWQFPGRTILFLAIAGASLLIAHRQIAQWLVRIIFRVLKHQDPAPRVSNMASAYGWMLLAWIFFALFQLLVVLALGFGVAGEHPASLMGVFLLSWLLGYLSFITPSGLGVREAVMAVLLKPYVSTPEAILIAVVSRILMILVEVVALAAVNAAAIRSRPANQ